jgi:hypothetical protein
VSGANTDDYPRAFGFVRAVLETLEKDLRRSPDVAELREAMTSWFERLGGGEPDTAKELGIELLHVAIAMLASGALECQQLGLFDDDPPSAA